MAIMIATIFTMEYKDIDIVNLFTGSSRFLLLVLSIILILGLVMLPPKYFLTKHIIWVLWLCNMALFLYPLYKENYATFYHSGLTTLLLVVGLSLFAYFKPELISDAWFNMLFVSLIVLLLATIVERLLANWGIIHEKKYSKTLSYIAIVLFSFWVLYDTKKILKNAENCVNPDYITQSLDIVLDSLNIFTNFANIKE